MEDESGQAHIGVLEVEQESDWKKLGMMLSLFGAPKLATCNPARTTIAKSLVQFSKHGNYQILGIKKLNKHSFGKMYLVKSYFLIGFHLKSFIKSLIFKIFFLLGLVGLPKSRPNPCRCGIQYGRLIWDCDNYHNHT